MQPFTLIFRQLSWFIGRLEQVSQTGNPHEPDSMAYFLFAADSKSDPARIGDTGAVRPDPLTRAHREQFAGMSTTPMV
jgi:hypothetical protein